MWNYSSILSLFRRVLCFILLVYYIVSTDFFTEYICTSFEYATAFLASIISETRNSSRLNSGCHKMENYTFWTLDL